jgi:hypothetical protein
MKPGFIIIALVGAALLLCAGCTDTSPGSVPPVATQTVPTPGPTDTLPEGQSVTIQVNEKDPIYSTISVTFAGGAGQVAVRDISVRVTRSDGQVLTDHLPAEKGAEILFQGTQADDRIEVFVTLNTGETYKPIDQLVPYRTRA